MLCQQKTFPQGRTTVRPSFAALCLSQRSVGSIASGSRHFTVATGSLAGCWTLFGIGLSTPANSSRRIWRFRSLPETASRWLASTWAQTSSWSMSSEKNDLSISSCFSVVSFFFFFFFFSRFWVIPTRVLLPFAQKQQILIPLHMLFFFKYYTSFI
ncbi:hypothetical protein MVEG_06522 [Podila verticillata NRRL 6337]|nr:hypothetical protein MVEG_06522 [Podila verticillata NRRL 6337]